MEFQEYPKALYKGGDQRAEHVIVSDGKEEAAKRKAGFKMLGETEAKGKTKGEQPPGDEQGEHAQDEQAPE